MGLRETAIDPQDLRELTILRKDLIGWRHIRKLSQDQLGIKAGITGDAVGSLEQGLTQSLLSSWQGVAKALEGQLKWQIIGLPQPDVTDELAMIQALRESNSQHHPWERMYLMTLLRHYRLQVLMSSADVAAQLNIQPGSLTDWEISSTDPALSRIMAYVRVLGGRFRIGLAVD